jgi:hypothetical protein
MFGIFLLRRNDAIPGKQERGDKEKRRQGEEETRRRGDKEMGKTLVSSSPCLLVRPLGAPSQCVSFGGANVVAFVVEEAPVPVPAGTTDDIITQLGLRTVALGCTMTAPLAEMICTLTN